MSHFIYMIRPTRSDLMQTMTPEEEVIIDRHFNYLKGLMAEGKLLLAGPCLDAAFGIVILITDDELQARSMMENDPAVQTGVMSSELHAFRVSLLQPRS